MFSESLEEPLKRLRSAFERVPTRLRRTAPGVRLMLGYALLFTVSVGLLFAPAGASRRTAEPSTPKARRVRAPSSRCACRVQVCIEKLSQLWSRCAILLNVPNKALCQQAAKHRQSRYAKVLLGVLKLLPQLTKL